VHDLLRASLPLRGLQRDDEVGGRDEADLPALVRGDEPEGDSKVRLTCTPRTSVIMPGARRLKFASSIRSTRGAAKLLLRLVASAMLVGTTWSSGSGTALSPCCPPG
jgi:hypothetical protein